MPELPPPLPPERRTVGQVVAESIRFYGEHFWRVLPLGLPLALVDQVIAHDGFRGQALWYWIATPLFVAAYLRACQLFLNARPNRLAIALAILIWLPFPALRATLFLPAIAWLAFVGLAVPAAMVEPALGFRGALVRGRQLGTVDYVHVLGSYATLVLVVVLSSHTLSTLIHTQGDTGSRVALFLSDLVLSPLLFIGGALLYVDQAARVGSRHADLHPSVDVERAGHPDAQVEP